MQNFDNENFPFSIPVFDKLKDDRLRKQITINQKYDLLVLTHPFGFYVDIGNLHKVLDEKSWDIDYEMRVLVQLIFDETNYFNFLKLSEEKI